MENANSTKADYLFHKERNSYQNNLDTGDKSLQCGRISDILKVWTYFKAHGWKSIAEQVERQHELANKLTDKLIQKSKEWILVYPAMTFNTSGFYIP